MKLAETIKAVETFHDAFGIQNNYEPTTDLSINEIELRHRLMQEENDGKPCYFLCQKGEYLSRA